MSVYKWCFPVATFAAAGLSLASAFAAGVPPSPLKADAPQAMPQIAVAVTVLDLSKLKLSDFADAETASR